MALRRRLRRLLCRISLFCVFSTFVWVTIKLHGKLNVPPGAIPYAMMDVGDRLQEHYLSRNNVGKQTDNQQFSACLLVMDDNHFLIEWLAYHYFALPLSRVIVAVDPRSETSPDPILRRWHGRLHLTRWDDADYMTSEELDEAEHYVRKFFKAQILDQPDLIRHRARQRLFYYKCMKQLKSEDQGWVALIDTDEFLSINYPTVHELGLEAPSIDQYGSVLAFLKREQVRPGNNLTSACVQIPRLRFGAAESPLDLVNDRVPLGFNASLLQTLRWRKHAARRNMIHNKISKTIIDLRRVDWDMLAPVDSIHRPIMSLCGHRRLYIQNKDQVFVIHHYLGSLEQYFYRNDSRTGKERSERAFHAAAHLDEIPTGNDDLRLWLRGFVTKFGNETASELLDGVGILERKPP